MSLIPLIPLYQAGRMVAEDLELTVETLRCREDREASGLVKKVGLGLVVLSLSVSEKPGQEGASCQCFT